VEFSSCTDPYISSNKNITTNKIIILHFFLCIRLYELRVLTIFFKAQDVTNIPFIIKNNLYLIKLNTNIFLAFESHKTLDGYKSNIKIIELREPGGRLSRPRGCNSFLNSLKNVSNLNLNGDYKITKSNYSNTSINIY